MVWGHFDDDEREYEEQIDNQRWVSTRNSEHEEHDEGYKVSKRKSSKHIEMPYWMRDSINFNGHDLT